MYQNEIPQDYLVWSSLAENRRQELLEGAETAQPAGPSRPEQAGWVARQVGQALRQAGTLLVSTAERLEGGEIQAAAS
jgi:hypothetical protein